MAWTTAGRQTNPGDGAVLADTGAQDGDGALTALVILSSTVLTTFIFQRRNAANDATVTEQYLDRVSGGTTTLQLQNMPYSDGERYRIVTSGAIVGAAQASLIY